MQGLYNALKIEEKKQKKLIKTNYWKKQLIN
jgi:hypothetical protein